MSGSLKGILAIAIVGMLAACGGDKPPSDSEATAALRILTFPGGGKAILPDAVAKINNCEKSEKVAGFMCSIDWNNGSGQWIRGRLAGFSKSKDGTWSVTRW